MVDHWSSAVSRSPCLALASACLSAARRWRGRPAVVGHDSHDFPEALGYQCAAIGKIVLSEDGAGKDRDGHLVVSRIAQDVLFQSKPGALVDGGHLGRGIGEMECVHIGA